jgi:hypothetical protein
LLLSDEFEQRLQEFSHFPGRQVINPLLGFLCSPQDLIKWRAVKAIGVVVALLADKDMESARIIMRRCIWNLNDESGGIGWGVPEAMGEIMALHEKLAEEYVCILQSYIRKAGNHLENPLLERGVVWGLGRLAQVRPHLLRDSGPDIIAYLESKDPVHRGFAASALGFLKEDSYLEQLEPLMNDCAELNVFENGKLECRRVCDLAARAVGVRLSDH